MIRADVHPSIFTEAVLSKSKLLEINRSKISLHHAKASYSYPTIWLRHTFSKLAGLSTRIYQTVHEGALAFLVVVSNGSGCKNKNEQSGNDKTSPKSPVLTWRRSPVRIRPGPSVFFFGATPANHTFFGRSFGRHSCGLYLPK
jgi:hypothetical protein